MAAPTAFTLVTLVSEALDKAGLSSPTTAEQDRGEDKFMEEIKNDVWHRGKKLNSLQKVEILVTSNGQDRYAQPTDFSSWLSLTVLDGTKNATAQDGAVGSITLVATDNSTETFMLGKKILIYSGTGAGSMSQCTAFSTTTKVATVTPDFTTAPDSTSKYIIIDSQYELTQEPIWDVNGLTDISRQGKPEVYYPIGDEDNGEIKLLPVPYRTGAIPWGIEQRYYANLMKLDLAGTRLATIYQKWSSFFIQGVYAKQLQTDDDDRADRELEIYRRMLGELVMYETYGHDLSNLQASVN